MSRKVFIVGLGGTTRPGSSSEKACEIALNRAATRGAETRLFAGRDLLLPIYDPQPGNPLSQGAADLIEALRRADGVILASPCYHGSLSGLLKNAIDYTEEMNKDTRVYLDGRAVGCIGCGFGWQGPNSVVSSLRSIVHALRGWPTPLAVAINSAMAKFTDAGCSEPAVTKQLELMADQVVDFAQAAVSRA